MRASSLLALAAAIALGGCPPADHAECVDESSCDLQAGGACVASPAGRDWCAYPDPACAGGLRYSERAGDGLAESCVTPVVDASVDAAPPCDQRVAYAVGSTGMREVLSTKLDGTGLLNLSSSAGNDSRPSWSSAGDLIVFDSDRAGNNDIFVVAATGSAPRNLTQTPGSDEAPVFSPDGTKIAYARQAPGAPSPTLWLMNADGTGQRELSTAPIWDLDALRWSPDGTRIAVYSARDVLTIPVAGGSAVNVCMWTTNVCARPAWAPDGSKLAVEVSVNAVSEIYVVDADGSNPKNITSSPANDGAPQWSPDGTSIAFATDRSGQLEIWRTDPTVVGAVQVTAHSPGAMVSDFAPTWSPRGDRIAFIRHKPDGPWLATVAPDGTNYLDFTVGPSPTPPVWAPCR